MRLAIKKLFILAIGGLLAATTFASGLKGSVPSALAEANSIELYQALLDLQNPWTVMCVAAHPDDEDGATLTILRRKQGVHTVTVFSTYGEGGQNAVGPELYEELGAIRVRETKEAAVIQGSEPYFLGLRDFGFSKSAEEAFRIWGHDEALRRLVFKIRELRPDVIITNHDTVSGHGHHQATGRLVLEAFDAAADASRFPEQLLYGVNTWQVQRLFVRFQFQPEGAGKSAEDDAARSGKAVSIDPNERDPIRNKTYAEQALEALQRHATQGPWPKTLPTGGRPTIRYRLARTAKDAIPLPANSSSVLDAMAFPAALSEKLTPTAARDVLQMSNVEHRQSLLRALVALKKAGLFEGATDVTEAPRFRLMKARLDYALMQASGVNVVLIPPGDPLIPGTTTHVTLKITNQGESDVTFQSIFLRGLLRPASFRFPKSLPAGSTISVELLRPTPATTGISVPAAEHLYDGKLIGEAVAVTVNVEIDGAVFPVSAAKSLDVAPAVEIIALTPSPLVEITTTPGHPELTDSAPGHMAVPGPASRVTKLTLRLINHHDFNFIGEVRVGPDVTGAAGRRYELRLGGHETKEISVELRDLDRFAEMGPRRQMADVMRIAVFGADRSTPVTRKEVRVIRVDARVPPQLKVGFIRSFDDTLRDSLSALGVNAQEMTPDDVRSNDLSAFQAIIIDNRGYQAHPELIAANSRLLDYVREGGTLIVFYHRTNEWNPDPKVSRPQLAPYPIMIGGSRVTDETAPITFTDPAHKLLNYPNKLTQEDFVGWIQERGLYYPETWDPHYSAPFAMSDAGEKPLRGGLLAAGYGRGHYIYTSMVWYRQLRAGIPGAYRMLANMISYGRSQMMNAER